MASSGYYTMHLTNDIMVFVCSIQCIFFKPANQKSVLFSLQNPCKERSKGREIKHIRNLDQIPNPNNHQRKNPANNRAFWVNPNQLPITQIVKRKLYLSLFFSYLFARFGSDLITSWAWPCLSVINTSYSIPDSCNTGPTNDLIILVLLPTPEAGFSTKSSLRKAEDGDQPSGETWTTPESKSWSEDGKKVVRIEWTHVSRILTASVNS